MIGWDFGDMDVKMGIWEYENHIAIWVQDDDKDNMYVATEHGDWVGRVVIDCQEGADEIDYQYWPKAMMMVVIGHHDDGYQEDNNDDDWQWWL